MSDFGSVHQLVGRRSLREQALEVLRESLISGEIRPGDVYSASALATKLGISNSPVREAVLTLVNQGLMEVVRNRGFRVVPIDRQDMAEIYELRLLLEVPAMSQLARMNPRPDLTEYYVFAEQARDAAEQGDIARVLELDRCYHIGLLVLSGNRRRVKIVSNLRDQTRQYGLSVLADKGELVGSLEEHIQILKAIDSGDPERTETLTRHHLEHVTGDWYEA